MYRIEQWIRTHATRTPDKVALTHDETRWTYRELDEETEKLALALAREGVVQGDRVGILGHPSAAWVKLFVALQKLGALATCINYRETPDQVIQMVQAVGAKRIFADGNWIDALEAKNVGVPMLPLLLETLTDLEGPATGDACPHVTDPEVGGIIEFTGGTTGASKGVHLTPLNLFWNCLNEIHSTRMSEWDVTLIATALHHSAALNTWLLPHFMLGAGAAVLSEFTPDGWLELAARAGATNTFMAPTMVRSVLIHPLAQKIQLPNFKRWYTGAGILPAHDRETMDRFVPGVGIYYQYGLTEAGPIVTCLQPEDYDRAPYSMGRAMTHCQVRVLREDRSLADVGEVGELVVRSPSVMKGYYNRPDATAAVMHDGWLLTGDQVSSDADGYLTFQDRSKDMIKTGGLNVYSQEVEMAIADHPDVREIAVVGLQDDHWGEMVTAVVTLHDGRVVSADEIISFGRERLSGYQTPKRVIFMAYEAMPRNYLGKVLKRELRTTLADGD